MNMNKRNKILNRITEERSKICDNFLEIEEYHSLIGSNCNNIDLCSLDIVQLLLNLEYIYNVEINYEEINSVSNLINFIMENGDIDERTS